MALDGNVLSMRLIALIVMVLAACATEEDPPAAEEARAATTTTVAPEPAPAEPSAPPAPRAIAVTGVEIDAGEVRLVAAGWPGRALDPVLTVGDVRLTRYDHPAPTVLRFFTDGKALDPRAPITLQYGDDAASRTVVRQ